MRLVALLILLVITLPSWAQTETPTATPTPTITPTPTDMPSIYATLAAPDGTPVGITARLDYTATAGDATIVVLLMATLFSQWAFFILYVFVIKGGRR